jgi:hypothetical protein
MSAVTPTDADISPAESLRLHTDWWGKCLTCRHWQTKVVMLHGELSRSQEPGLCGFEKSDLAGQETWIEGHCGWWDSYDVDTALRILDGESA